MKKIVLICSLISGLILSIFIIVSTILCFSKDKDFEGSMAVGYACMLMAFSLIFVGVKNYRDKYNGGFISFGKAFRIGLYISLIASSIYVLVWMIDYHFFIPDFMDKYSAHMIAKSRSSGIGEIELAQKVKEIQDMKELYKNPLVRILFTYAEVLPVGLIVSLICGLILKKRKV